MPFFVFFCLFSHQVFCALEFDPELFAIYLSYTDPAQLFAVWYAAVELQQSSLPPAKERRRVAEKPFHRGLGDRKNMKKHDIKGSF